MKRAALCCIFILSTCHFLGADEIVLYDGQKARTKILDTTGCSVVIDRNGRAVAIRKRGVDRIIMNGDTVCYADFVCKKQKKESLASRIENLRDRVADMPYRLRPLDTSETIGVVGQSLKLAYDSRMDVQHLVDSSTAVLSEYKMKVKEVSIPEAFDHLDAGSTLRYLLFFTSLKSSGEDISPSDYGPVPAGPVSIHIKTLNVTLDMSIVDVRKRVVVYAATIECGDGQVNTSVKPQPDFIMRSPGSPMGHVHHTTGNSFIEQKIAEKICREANKGKPDLSSVVQRMLWTGLVERLHSYLSGREFNTMPDGPQRPVDADGLQSSGG